MSNNRNLRISNNTADKFKNVPASNRNALVKGYNKSSFNKRRSVFGKGQPTTNNDMSNTIVVNANVRNNTNPVKQALDEKIEKLFGNKEYDLIVHFKGFNELFKEGTYNGYSRETLKNTNFTEENKISHIDDIAKEFEFEISRRLNNTVKDKTLLLVWDGDGLDDFQWTRVMIATAQKLVDQEANIEFLCCYNLKTDKNPWGVENPTNTLNHIGFKNNHIFEYKELGVNGYEEVGMVLLYITSNLLKKNNNPILVLCAGGGKTPLDEYKFTKNDSTIVNDTSKYNLANKLVESMNPEKFKWMASSLIKSRKNKNENDGIELSKMTPDNEIEIIKNVNVLQPVRLTVRGGARKKRTKTLKKKKSLKKKSKKNKSKSKSKRKC